MTRIAINQSRVKSWRNCHRQHWYRYVEKITKKTKSRPLVFGTLIHEMLEAFANADDPWEVHKEKTAKQRKLFRAEREEYGDIVRDSRYIMQHYFEFWPENSLRYIRLNKRGAEHIFEIEIAKDIYWKGKIDAFCKVNFGPSKGLVGLVEHKTMKQPWSEDDRWRNVQSVTYKRAADAMGWPSVDGTLWDYIVSKPPGVPRINRDGTMHKGKFSSLPYALKDFFEENPNLKISKLDQERMLKAAEENVPKYFSRVFTPVKKEVEENVFADFMETVIEIADTGDKKKARNIGRHCSWCEYEPICRAELQGLDVDYVKEKEYAPDEEPEAKLETTDE